MYFFIVSKFPLSKFASATFDTINGTCIITKNAWGGQKRSFTLAEKEMIDFVLNANCIHQFLRRYQLYCHLYRQGRMSKAAVMAKGRKHERMMKIGELNGATCSLFAKRKDLEDDSDDSDCEGVVNTSHNIYVNVKFQKIDHFAGHEFGLPTNFVTLTHEEYAKLEEALKKYLEKKEITVEQLPAYEEVLSDLDEDEEEQGGGAGGVGAGLAPILASNKQNKRKHVQHVAFQSADAPAAASAPKKRARKAAKKGRQNQLDPDEECLYNEDVHMHVCKCKDCLAKSVKK